MFIKLNNLGNSLYAKEFIDFTEVDLMKFDF